MGRLVSPSISVYLTSVNLAQIVSIPSLHPSADHSQTLPRCRTSSAGTSHNLLGLVSTASFPSSEGVFDFSRRPTRPPRSIKCQALFGRIRPGLADLLSQGLGPRKGVCSIYLDPFFIFYFLVPIAHNYPPVTLIHQTESNPRTAAIHGTLPRECSYDAALTHQVGLTACSFETASNLPSGATNTQRLFL